MKSKQLKNNTSDLLTNKPLHLLYSEIMFRNEFNFSNYSIRFDFRHDDDSIEAHRIRAHEFCHFMQIVATNMGWFTINNNMNTRRCIYWLCNKIGKRSYTHFRLSLIKWAIGLSLTKVVSTLTGNPR